MHYTKMYRKSINICSEDIDMRKNTFFKTNQGPQLWTESGIEALTDRWADTQMSNGP